MDWIGAQCGVVMGSTNLSMTRLEDSIADVDHKPRRWIQILWDAIAATAVVAGMRKLWSKWKKEEEKWRENYGNEADMTVWEGR